MFRQNRPFSRFFIAKTVWESAKITEWELMREYSVDEILLTSYRTKVISLEEILSMKFLKTNLTGQGRAGWRLASKPAGQGTAGYGRKFTGQGRMEVVNLLTGQDAGCQNTVPCSALHVAHSCGSDALIMWGKRDFDRNSVTLRDLKIFLSLMNGKILRWIWQKTGG